MSHRQRALKMLGFLLTLGLLHAALLYASAWTGVVSKVLGGGPQAGFGAALLVCGFAVVRAAWLLLGPGLALLTIGYGLASVVGRRSG